ncbi:recombinase family protein [Vibrio hepatarius]|uniref:recombinase family protein n=1 Tax=Vibrio hepatarius TaxID=171383 RepID=UPI000A7416F8|nr:recombinase family protein [Vibrio hepatarius]
MDKLKALRTYGHIVVLTMTNYFNANHIKTNETVYIKLANGLSVELTKLPTGLLRATNPVTGDTFCTSAATARLTLSKWEAEEVVHSSKSTHKGQHVGYIRVSTLEQSTSRQLVDVELDRVFTEKTSAKTVERPELQACIQYLREGDTLHVHSLDRVCRSGAGDAVMLVETLNAKGVSVVFHKEGMSFNGSMTAAQKGVLGILASVAQMERELILERQREGIAAAKALGKHMGRPKTSLNEDELKRLVAEGLSVSAIAKQLGSTRQSVYRRMEALGLR